MLKGAELSTLQAGVARGRLLGFRLEGSKVIDRCGRVFGVAVGGLHLQNLASC